MIRDIIQMSFLILIGDLTLIVFILFNSTLSRRRRAAFLASAGISLLMVICNMIVYLFEGTGTHRTLLEWVCAVSYAVSGPVVLPVIALSGVIAKNIRRCLYAFAGCNAVLSFVSIWNGCIFCFDASCTMHLGQLSPIPYFLSAMYLAVILAASFIKFRLGFRGESGFLAVLCVGILAATVLNTAFHYKFLISGMAVLSCIFYYLFYTTQTLTRDALTNALNRHSFYKDIALMKKRQMIVVSMDLNGLKQINDTQGHDAGDRAILTVADCIHEILPVRCRLYRMGGDEFEILCPAMPLAEGRALVSKIKAAVQAKGYSTAAGLGEYTKEMDFEAVFRTVDEQMYQDKRRMKAERKGQRNAE